MKVHKGNKVIVLAGKDKGKRGTIEQVMPRNNMVVVGGINVVKRHVKPSQRYPGGGIIELAAPLHCSNVMALDPDTDTPTKGQSKAKVNNKGS